MMNNWKNLRVLRKTIQINSMEFLMEFLIYWLIDVLIILHYSILNTCIWHWFIAWIVPVRVSVLFISVYHGTVQRIRILIGDNNHLKEWIWYCTWHVTTVTKVSLVSIKLWKHGNNSFRLNLKMRKKNDNESMTITLWVHIVILAP